MAIGRLMKIPKDCYLTTDGKEQIQFQWIKEYYVQVDGVITEEANDSQSRSRDWFDGSKYITKKMRSPFDS
jgi:glyoxylate utilization-related uncharacterized protein